MHRISGAWKKNCFSFRCDSYDPWTPTKCDLILIFASFYNKVCCGITYFNTKMSYLSDFKCTKSKTLRTASSRRMTNWVKLPCDPVQIIRTKDWYFKSLIIVNTAKSYFFTNLHVIYFWNGHRERLSSHLHLQLHTRLAERYRWRCADLHSDAIMLSGSVPVDFLRPKFRVAHTKHDVISILMNEYTYINMYIIKKIISCIFILCWDITALLKLKWKFAGYV